MLVPAPNRAASPGRIMHCTVVYPLDLYPAFFGYYFFNFMMVVLQSLHIFWAYLIIRMAQKFITGKARGGPGTARGSQSRRETLLRGKGAVSRPGRCGSGWMEGAGLLREQGGGGGFAGETPKPRSQTALAFPRVLESPWWGGNGRGCDGGN